MLRPRPELLAYVLLAVQRLSIFAFKDVVAYYFMYHSGVEI